jgi:hypothetical protein
MNLPADSTNSVFHSLAQRLMVMRMTLESTLESFPATDAGHEALEHCMVALEQLTQDVGLLREITCVEPSAELSGCDGAEVLRSSVEEMTPVALACGVHLQVDATPAWLMCNKATLAQALFVLLDELTGSSKKGTDLFLTLRPGEVTTLLEVCPALQSSMRQVLCHRLLCAAGGEIVSAENVLRVAFRSASGRHIEGLSLADKQLLTRH